MIRLIATCEVTRSINLVVVLLIPLSEFLEDRARESKNEARPLVASEKCLARRKRDQAPQDRRRPPSMQWQQTKSGSSARPEPPAVDQEVEAPGIGYGDTPELD